ncbi:MAG: CotH kinase family protein [Nitrospirae bacterium]|nr:CotH kinase family protein [Nitrospirota bacterium]
MKINQIIILTAIILFMGWIDAGAAENHFKTLDLEMDTKDAEVLFRKEPYDTSTFPVDIVENGTRISGRVEVSGQFTRTFLKKSLLIRINEGHTWQGNRKISLHSMSTDPSYMRDWIAWNLASSLGMASPKVEYYRLNINGKFIGLYLFIEWIDTSMLNRIGLGKDGEFYHPDDIVYCGDMEPANQGRLEECWLKLSPKDRDFASLRNLIEEINSTPVEQFHSFLNEHFDVDSVINWLVLNTIIGNGDTYNKNYFLYHSKKTGKWVIIPWDFDLTFGRNADPVLPFPSNILNDNYQYFYTPELGSPNPLKEKTLKNDQLFQYFKKRISHVLGVTIEKEQQGFFEKLRKESKPVGGFAWFRPNEFNSLVNSLELTIKQDLSKELYPGAKGEPFEQQVEALRLYNQWRYPLLKKMILEPTPFNTAHWLPYFTFPPLTLPGEDEKKLRQTVQLNMTASAEIREGDKSVVLMEELLARPVGILYIQELNRPARVRLEVETERIPESLPPEISPLKCIQRTWYLDIKTPDTLLKVNLQLDYLQESSLRHELGDGITDEHNMSLWVLQNNNWRRLQTGVNVIANVLKAGGIELVSGSVLRFAACEE